MSDSRSSSCFSSLSFFLSFFPSPGVTLRRREIETGLTVFRTASQLRNDSDPLVAAPLEHRDAGLFRHPLCAPRCTVHVCHPAIRHASGFKCVLRSRVLIRVNVRYISTRCLHCAPVTKDIAIVTTLVVPPFFYAYWKRAEERGGPANAEPHQKKGRKKSTAYEKPFEPSIRVCKKKRVYVHDECDYVERKEEKN